MTVKQLIELLSKLNPEAIVLAYDPDVAQPAIVQGAIHNDKYVTIQTDIP